MLDLKIDSASSSALQKVHVPKVELSLSRSSRGWIEIKPPQPWQINGSSDHLSGWRTCKSPKSNLQTKYDDRIRRDYHTCGLGCCYTCSDSVCSPVDDGRGSLETSPNTNNTCAEARETLEEVRAGTIEPYSWSSSLDTLA